MPDFPLPAVSLPVFYLCSAAAVADAAAADDDDDDDAVDDAAVDADAGVCFPSIPDLYRNRCPTPLNGLGGS